VAAAVGRGKVRALADAPLYRRATAGLPAGRVLDGYVSADGLRTLAAPSPGLLGAAGVLLDRPGLDGLAFAAVAQDHGARLVAHAVGHGAAPRTVSPSLTGRVPAGVLAALDVPGVSAAAQRLLRAAGGLGGTLDRVRRQVARQPGLGRRLTALFSGETAAWVAPGLPAPVLTIVTKVPDADAARATMADLQGPLSAAFAPGAGAGLAPTFDVRRVGAVNAFQLRLGPGVELDYAIFDGLLAVSTRLDGLAAAQSSRDRLADTAPWRAVLSGAPSQVTALGFLDFSQLLRIGEQTGLDRSRAYRRVRDDLARVRAVGLASTGSADQTTAQVELSIP
jgi:hypothetical protein